MRRREFIKYSAGAVGGLSVAIAADVVGLGPAALAAARPDAADVEGHRHEATDQPVEVVDDFRSKGRRVQIVRRGRETRMRIDGRELSHHHFMEDGGVYKSHLLPFREDRKARDLANALLEDDGVLFKL